MPTAIKIIDHFIQTILRSAKYGYLLELVSIAWGYMITAGYLSNQFGFYPFNKLAQSLILFPFI